jgi:hypothetical protein
MAATKKKASSSFLGACLRGLFGSGRNVLIFAVLLGLLGCGVGFIWWKLGDRNSGISKAWREFKDRILAEHRIGPEQVQITPQPPWIPNSDVRAEVFRNPTLDASLSLTDDDLAERIANAFARHPWVAKVPKVTKKHGTVEVELVYRKPACMVEVPGGYQPVDTDGVLLPSADFTSQETRQYPRLLHVDRGPTMAAGYRWGDTRVVGGAEIAAALADVWEPMRLQYIEPWAAYPPPASPAPVRVDAVAMPTQLAGQAVEPVFTLVTQGKTRIAWGYAPGANVAGEMPIAEKVARLKRYFNAHETLDGPQGKPQELDVRTLPLVGP